MYKRQGPTRIVVKDEIACYHCYCRAVNKELLFDDRAKTRFASELRRVAAFSGIQVLTYCCMTSHFHLLVRVDPAAAQVDDAELVRRFRILYGERKSPYLGLNAAGIASKLKAGMADAKELREHLRSRMGNLPAFMKTLKQRFSVWFNAEYCRVGTLWAERYKCTLIQDSPEVLRLVGAYIELNPVRAGIVERPEDYKWAGFATTQRGDGWSRSGLLLMLGEHRLTRADPTEKRRFIESYALLLGKKLGKPPDCEGRVPVAGATPRGQELLERIPGVVRGAVVGLQDFVAGWSARLYLSARPPVVCVSTPGLPELYQARRHRR